MTAVERHTVGAGVMARVDEGKVLQALGISANDPKAHAVLLICDRYNLDPLLRHVQIVQQQPYVTRDGYLHIAHESGVFDGLDIQAETELKGGGWRVKVAVYRKDMTRPFVATGTAKPNERKGQDPYDMALARAERRALKRAFNVAGDAVESTLSDADVYTEPSLPEPTGANSDAVELAPAPVDDDGERIPPPVPLPGEEPGKAETGELPTDEVRQAFVDRATALDMEHRPILVAAWQEADIGNPKLTADRPLLLSEVDRYETILAAVERQQAEAYDHRRKVANMRLKEAGITSDDARHQAIRDATGGQTESSKALTAEQFDAVIAYCDGLAVIEAMETGQG